jgi:transcriptional regulator with XRE-family HTH domain
MTAEKSYGKMNKKLYKNIVILAGRNVRDRSMAKDKHPNEALRYHRLLRGWSQHKVADEIGASNEMISRWEGGMKKTSIFYQEKLCALFGKNAEELGFLLPAANDRSREAPVQEMESGLNLPMLNRGEITQQSDASSHQQGEFASLLEATTKLVQRPQNALLTTNPVLTTIQEETGSTSTTVIELYTKERISHLFVASHGQMLLLSDYKEIANNLTLWYDSLEETVIKMVMRQRLHQESLYLIQKHVREKIKDYDLMAQQHANDETRISRRYALKAIAQFPILAYGLTALDEEITKDLPPAEEILPLCAAGLTACKGLLEEGDFSTIAAVLRKYLPTLERWAYQSSKHQQAAAHLASQSYLLAIMIADQQGKLDHMETFSREAQRYGQRANDPNLQVSALARLAVKFDYERRDRKALQTYQEAKTNPAFRQVSPLLQGRIYAGLAGTNAYVRQKADAEYFLGLAKEVFPEKADEDPSFQFAYSGNDTIFLWEGLTRKHLGQYTEAYNTFLLNGKLQLDATSRPLPGFHDRNRAEFLNYAASVAIKQKQLDISCFYVEAAEEIAWTIKHEQRYTEVLETVRSIETVWPHELRVKHLLEKVRARKV